ncbi:hypothetical protein KKB10_02445 [Patescibacteria group bacterium]|nr:hypothetical protein [Patescibacteria group bacterium]MBU1951337.1 hypothetical protein [Patescibacteria group bacterium]
MKKVVILLIVLLLPTAVLAEPMLRPADENTNEEVIIDSEDVTNTNESEEVTVISVNIDLPDLKWVPSTPLYFLKTWWEEARGWFMISAVKKAEYRIELANRRLEEIEVLVQKKKTEVISETTARFNEQIAKANKYIEKAKEKGKDLENVYRLLEENRVKHQITFSQLDNMVPDDAKAMIDQAKQTSQDSFESAQERIKEKAKEGVTEGIDSLQEKLEDALE